MQLEKPLLSLLFHLSLSSINNISCPNFTLTSSFSLNNALSPRKSLLTPHLEIIFPKLAWHLVCLSVTVFQASWLFAYVCTCLVFLVWSHV